MANMMIPAEERGLTPNEVEALDRRRRRGQLFFVIAGMAGIVSILLTLWTGQDLTYSPTWHKPMFFWNCVTGALTVFFFLAGLRLRRGLNEFFSY